MASNPSPPKSQYPDSTKSPYAFDADQYNKQHSPQPSNNLTATPQYLDYALEIITDQGRTAIHTAYTSLLSSMYKDQLGNTIIIFTSKDNRTSTCQISNNHSYIVTSQQPR